MWRGGRQRGDGLQGVIFEYQMLYGIKKKKNGDEE